MDKMIELYINMYTIIIAINVNILVDMIKPCFRKKDGAVSKLIYAGILFASVAEVFLMHYTFNADIDTGVAQWFTVAIVSIVLYDIGGYAKIKQGASAIYNAIVSRITKVISGSRD